MMDVVAFNIWGPYGHFRKAYAPLSPVTYPCPTPTAICGLIGAILGLEKHDYLDRINQGDFRVGVQLLNPVKKFRAAINLIKASNRTLGDFIQTDVHDQIPYEFLKDPAFRIFFWHENNSLIKELCSTLKTGKTVYTPVLGLASCLASVAYVGIYGTEIQRKGEEVPVCTWVPAHAAVRYEENRHYQRFRMPARMLSDRTVTRFDEVIVAEDGCPIYASGVELFKIQEHWACLL